MMIVSFVVVVHHCNRIMYCKQRNKISISNLATACSYVCAICLYHYTVSYSTVVLYSRDREGLHFLTDQKPALQYLHGAFAVLLRYKVHKCLQCKLKCVQYVAMN